MNTIRHVTNTWLLAQLLYPLIYIFYFSILKNGDYLDMMVVFIIADFLFSLPAYVLCLISFDFVSRMRIGITAKFYLWIVLAILCVYVGVSILIVLLFDLSWLTDVQFVIIPGYIAAAVSVLIRRSNFRRLMKSLEEPHVSELPSND